MDQNDPAPGFTACDEQGHLHRLSEYRGKTLVLFFSPSFREALAAVKKKDVFMLGVTTGSVQANGKLRQEKRIPFPILADPQGKICRAYGAWSDRAGVKPSTVVIGPDGVVRLVLRRVHKPAHVAELLRRPRAAKASLH